MSTKENPAKNNKLAEQLDEQRRKMAELYVPPGVIKVERVYDREVKIKDDIRKAVPSDKLYVRKSINDDDKPKKDSAHTMK